MKVGSKQTFVGAAAIAVMCLLGVATVRGQAPAQGAQPMSETVFKNIALLRGIPVDTFFESMGMFAAAMGNDCTFCHDTAAYFDKNAFANPTPRIQKARQMIVMMNAINKTYFAGQTRVTCFTCHAGSMQPVKEPNLAIQYGEPAEDPNARDFPADTRVTADQVFTKYLQAVGGAERLAKFTSFTGKGVYAGFDTSFSEIPVEVFAKAPNQRTLVVHMDGEDSFRVYNGEGGWMAGPDTPVQLLTLTAGNLTRARLEAMVAFPNALPKAFNEWRLGRTDIGGKEVRIVQGRTNGQPVANFYFDDAGLLVRMVTWTETPVGIIPTQIDYTEYREVPGTGVRMPFHWTVSQTYMQMNVTLKEVRANVAIDAARFARPAPAKAIRRG